MFVSNLQFGLRYFSYEWNFDSDLEDWTVYTNEAGYGSVSFNAGNGHDAAGSVYADTKPQPPGALQRFAGVKFIISAPMSIAENDVLSAWGYNIAEVQAGPGDQSSGIQVEIYFTDSSSVVANNTPGVGDWGQATLTVGAGDAGKIIDYILVYAYSNSRSTIEMYLDDIIFLSTGALGGVCNVQMGALPTGDPVYVSNVRMG